MQQGNGWYPPCQKDAISNREKPIWTQAFGRTTATPAHHATVNDRQVNSWAVRSLAGPESDAARALPGLVESMEAKGISGSWSVEKGGGEWVKSEDSEDIINL
uniref:Uncharacterized protein n=1 Tax=Oryza nivara TaxID=4536 RepID=A0A0E0HX25_ORYNI